MAEGSELPDKKMNKKGLGCLAISLIRFFYMAIIALLLGIALGPTTGSISHARAASAMFIASTISQCMYRYSVDHHGQYPVGKSSTEVFIKLLKEGYINDPTIFYFSGTPGKSKPTLDFDSDHVDWGAVLKPENVCYDVTVPIDKDSPGDLPVVFLTGYKIIYAPGASALPLSSAMKDRQPCMAVAYQNKTIAWFLRDFWTSRLFYSLGGYQGQYYVFDPQRTKLGGKVLSDGTITLFIPSSFNPAGKTYQQLTPNGPLSP